MLQGRDVLLEVLVPYIYLYWKNPNIRIKLAVCFGTYDFFFIEGIYFYY